MEQQGINRYMRGICVDCGGPRSTRGTGRCRVCADARRAVPHPVCTGCGKTLDYSNITHLCMACITRRSRARVTRTERAQESTTRPQTRRPLTAEQQGRADLLTQSVCGVYNVSVANLRSVSRTVQHSEPRQLLVFLLMTKAGLSATQAAAWVRRDHATALHAKVVTAQRIQERPRWAEGYRLVRDAYRAARAEALGLTPPQEQPRTLLDDYYQARRMQHREVVSYAS